METTDSIYIVTAASDDLLDEDTQSPLLKQVLDVKHRLVLPTNVTPTHYLVDLSPNAETFVFQGTVEIVLTVGNQPTKSITCNSNELDIKSAILSFATPPAPSEASATVPASLESWTSTAITYDTSKEQVTFEFDKEIPAEIEARLKIEFTGQHNDKMAGFYR